MIDSLTEIKPATKGLIIVGLSYKQLADRFQHLTLSIPLLLTFSFSHGELRTPLYPRVR